MRHERLCMRVGLDSRSPKYGSLRLGKPYMNMENIFIREHSSPMWPTFHQCVSFDTLVISRLGIKPNFIIIEPSFIVGLNLIKKKL